MQKNLHEYRKSYEKGTLDIKDVDQNPLLQFKKWFHEAEISQTVDEINAMTLSTVDKNGMPRGRVVLLKEITEQGFIYYSNYKSLKGDAIAANPKVSISFFWPGLERQIIIQGMAEKISEEKSIAYFAKRPFKSQLGALVSNQSSEIESREILEKKLIKLEQEYEGKVIPKPEHWGGYIIKPITYEFWQGRKSRLHDRILYSKTANNWTIKRLQP